MTGAPKHDAVLSVDEAQARLLAGATPLPEILVDLPNALGHQLSRPLLALRTQPPFAASAMDGYAIRWTDRAGPWQVTGESAAGHRHDGTLAPGCAIRILTGAPLPGGADTVIVQEDVTRDGANLRLTGDGPPRQGAHIRRAGLDFAAGDVLAPAGTLVTPARLGLFAAAGYAKLPVYRRPRLALLATGDELVPPGVLPGPDQIISSNGVMLAALLGRFADVIDAGIAPDNASQLDAAIAACADADVLVTIGGASVGDHDLVRPALLARGGDIDFWKVAIRPGKPILYGRLGAQHVVGLPGNPVSAFVCALLFVVPLLKRLAGSHHVLPTLHLGRSAVALPAGGNRRDYQRAVATLITGEWQVQPSATQDSSMLCTLAASNALLVRDVDAPAVVAGDPVSFLLLDSLSDVA